jgi:transcriptional regulator with XRE-family HTH domain
MAKSKKSLTDRLRDEIRRAEKRGITRYRIARITGLTEGQLSRMMHAKPGKAIPRLDSAEKIAGAIGCKIVIVRG